MRRKAPILWNLAIMFGLWVALLACLGMIGDRTFTNTNHPLPIFVSGSLG